MDALDPRRSSRRQPLRLGTVRYVAPLALAVLLIACGLWLRQRGEEQHTVSHVVRTIRDLARDGGATSRPGAGALGPWRIAAAGVDATNGDLLDFRLVSGSVLVAARRARVQADPETDSFTIELEAVTYTSLPETGSEREAFVHAMDKYTLGPAAWRVDIIADAADAADAAEVPDAASGGSVAPVDAAGLVRALEAMRPDGP